MDMRGPDSVASRCRRALVAVVGQDGVLSRVSSGAMTWLTACTLVNAAMSSHLSIFPTANVRADLSYMRGLMVSTNPP